MIPLLYIGIAFSCFTIIFFLVRRKLRPENILASAFLFFLAMPILTKLMSIGAVSLPVPHAFLLIHSYPFTFGPFLYLYTKAEIGSKPVFRKIYLLHFLPFILFSLLPFVFPQMEPARPAEFARMEMPPANERKFERFDMPPPLPFHERPDMPGAPQLFHERQDFPGPPPDLAPHGEREPVQIGGLNKDIPQGLKILAFFLILSFLVYTILVLLMINRHKRSITNYFSYNSDKVNLKWLQWLTICFAISYLFVLVSSRIKPDMFIHPILNPGITTDIAISFFILVFCFFAVRQPVIYGNRDISSESDTNDIIGGERKKYKKSGLKDTEAKVYLEKLERIMKNEKLYLNGDLTIEDIAKQIDIPRHHLTQALNENLNKNFFMYVNEFRVQEAKAMMEDEKYKDYTIIRIAYDSGFNTKSGFNSVFKKFTGCTPSEYRKKNISTH